MMHIDYAVSEDCINIYTFGEICVGCGCCSRNPNYRDMIRRRLKYYKEMLEKNYTFSDWHYSKKIRKLQERNVKADILYFKRKIRLCKRILRTKGGVE